jgi:hypothetical protein
MSVYPSNIPTTGDLPDAGANLSSNPHSSLHDDVRDEVIAIAGELGVEPSGTASTVRARLDDGLGLRQIVTFTSDGTFTKASYPWLRAVRVRVQGGGGAGGGAQATGANENSFGAGGGGGGYSERFILASALSASESVTVGAGGSAVTGAAGGTGGTSQFGSLLSATGGGGGPTRDADTALRFTPGSTGTGVGSGGDINARGGAGSPGFNISPGTATLTQVRGGVGGGSVLSGGSREQGATGSQFGGGGGGAVNVTSSSAVAGGAGAAGIVIVELYA